MYSRPVLTTVLYAYPIVGRYARNARRNAFRNLKFQSSVKRLQIDPYRPPLSARRAAAPGACMLQQLLRLRPRGTRRERVTTLKFIDARPLHSDQGQRSPGPAPYTRRTVLGAERHTSRLVLSAAPLHIACCSRRPHATHTGVFAQSFFSASMASAMSLIMDT